MLEEALALVAPGGFYVVDDMLPQENWPDGHALKAADLVTTLESHEDFHITKLSWGSGLVIAVKQEKRAA